MKEIKWKIPKRRYSNVKISENEVLKGFYKDFFNIEIIGLLKKKKENDYNFCMGERHSGITFTSLNNYTMPEFIILIKDNNKKFFKYKKLFVSSCYFYVDKEDYIENLFKDMWKEIDKHLYKYCKIRLERLNPILLKGFIKQYKDFIETHDKELYKARYLGEWIESVEKESSKENNKE